MDINIFQENNTKFYYSYVLQNIYVFSNVFVFMESNMIIPGCFLSRKM
jgi:hypothetical protein